jgi:hypothetical protein
MLTAKQARALQPRTDVERVLEEVERVVRNAAAADKTQVDITSLLPNWSGWVCGKPNADLDAVQATLTKAGYRVETFAGGHAGRGFVRLHWSA